MQEHISKELKRYLKNAKQFATTYFEHKVFIKDTLKEICAFFYNGKVYFYTAKVIDINTKEKVDFVNYCVAYTEYAKKIFESNCKRSASLAKTLRRGRFGKHI